MNRAGQTPELSAVVPGGTLASAPARPASSPAGGRWFVVEAPYFCGLVMVDAAGTITRASSALEWILPRRDRSLAWFRGYARAHRWTLEELPP